jgi:hypothetical protein
LPAKSRMKFSKSLLFLLLLYHFSLSAQDSAKKHIRQIDGSRALKEIGTLPKHIKEASGLEITKAGNLWTHNDGGVPMLFCIDSTGELKKSLQLNHPNSGWEDLTQDAQGNFYVGAFGNNKNDKRELKIYKIPNPDLITEKVYTAEIIKYRYKDQQAFPPSNAAKNFDMDAFAASGDELFLFTKNRTSPFTGYTKVYRLPQSAGSYELMPVDSIYLGSGPMMDNWVTAADITDDGKTLALLSHQCLWLVSNFSNSHFSQGNITRINLNHFSHKAGLCFRGNDTLYIVDELELGLLGGKVYTLSLRDILQNPQ